MTCQLSFICEYMIKITFIMFFNLHMCCYFQNLFIFEKLSLMFHFTQKYYKIQSLFLIHINIFLFTLKSKKDKNIKNFT